MDDVWREPSMIEIKNLAKYRDTKLIFESVNLSVEPGETLAVIGQSGCGKTTLLKCIIGLEKPTKGSVLLSGHDITKIPQDKLDEIRKKIGMVFQEGALFDSMNVLENVAFPLRQHTNLSEKEISDTVAEKLELMGMEGTQMLMPSQLSGGMRRRVGLARALVMDPDILLFDEPTTGLDPVMTTTISDLIVLLKERFKTASVIVTHDMPTAFKVADFIGMMSEGTILALGTADEIKNSTVPKVRQFVRGERINHEKS